MISYLNVTPFRSQAFLVVTQLRLNNNRKCGAELAEDFLLKLVNHSDVWLFNRNCYFGFNKLFCMMQKPQTMCSLPCSLSACRAIPSNESAKNNLLKLFYLKHRRCSSTKNNSFKLLRKHILSSISLNSQQRFATKLV